MALFDGVEYAEGDANDNGDVMGPNGHFLTKCDGCAQTDDHPFIHLGDWSGHFDCLPSAAVLTLTRDAEIDPRADARNHAITAALSGIHGDELRQAISDYHDEKIGPALAELEG